ncbi:MAG: sulfite exporter TauE/SafE family protein [Pseudomonadota bacterium]
MELPMFSATMFTDLGLQIFLASLFITFLAGIIKGAVGFAMPLVMVSGLSSIMAPQLAIGAMILPVVASNALQTFRHGVAPVIGEARAVWRYLLVVSIFIVLTAQLLPYISTQVFYFVLGVPVVALSLIQLFGVRLTIPPERRRRAEWGIGALSGILGGLAGTWGPTTVLYLLAIEMPKARQLIVQGLIYGTGAVMLLFAHLQSGIFNGATAPFSAALLVPAYAGMALGFWLGDRLDQARFRSATLIVLTVAGLNLIRKGFFG